jgi:hypothetical protein
VKWRTRTQSVVSVCVSRQRETNFNICCNSVTSKPKNIHARFYLQWQIINSGLTLIESPCNVSEVTQGDIFKNSQRNYAIPLPYTLSVPRCITHIHKTQWLLTFCSM